MSLYALFVYPATVKVKIEKTENENALIVKAQANLSFALHAVSECHAQELKRALWIKIIVP